MRNIVTFYRDIALQIFRQPLQMLNGSDATNQRDAR